MRTFRGQPGDRDIEQALIALKKGTNVLKHGRQGRPKTCYFWLSADETAVCYHSDKQKSVPLSSVTQVVRGQITAVFRRHLQLDKEHQSLSLIYNRGERTLDIVCQRIEEADIWWLGLQALLGRLPRDKGDGAEQQVSPLASGPSPSPKELSPSFPHLSPVTSPFNNSVELMSQNSSIPAVPVYIYGSNGTSSEVSLGDVREGMEWESGSNADSLRGSFGGGSQGGSSGGGGGGSWGADKPIPSPDGFLSGPLISRSGLVMSTDLAGHGAQPGGGGGDDEEALGDVFMWGEGLGGGAWGMQSPANGSRGDAPLPVKLEACAVLDVAAMACGSRHAALLTRQGEVFCWGEEKGGRLGQGVDGDVQHPHLVEAMASIPVDSVACGDYHTCSVTREGELYTWGDGAFFTGAAGQGASWSPWLPKPVTVFGNEHRVTQVACGPWHSAVVTEIGQLFTFGDGTFGALGHGDNRSMEVPTEVQTLKCHRTVQVACGVWHTAAVVDVLVSDSVSGREGTVFTWGDGDKGCLGHGNEQTRLLPTPVSTFQDFPCTQVACGRNLTAVLTATGQVYTMGRSSHGQLGRKTADGARPGLVEGELQGKQVEQIACGTQHVAVVVAGAELYTWGKGEHGRLGHGDFVDRNFPTRVEALEGRRVLQVACGATFTAAICALKRTSSSDQRACSHCRLPFGLTRVRHGCYHCGRPVCHSCSSRKALGAAMAPSSLKPSRVCDSCYSMLSQGLAPTLHSVRRSPSVPKWARQWTSDGHLSDSFDLGRKGGESVAVGESGKRRLQGSLNNGLWGTVVMPKSFSESGQPLVSKAGLSRPNSDPSLIGGAGEKGGTQLGSSTGRSRKGRSGAGSPMRRSSSPARRATSPMRQAGGAGAISSPSGFTGQEGEVWGLRRSNQAMGHELNKLRVLVEEWRERCEVLERALHDQKRWGDAQAAEVETGNELLAALSTQLSSAIRMLPPGSSRHAKVVARGVPGTILYSGPLLVSEPLPASLMELTEGAVITSTSTIAEEDGLPHLIRTSSPGKRALSRSETSNSGSLSRGFSISHLWHHASRSSRERSSGPLGSGKLFSESGDLLASGNEAILLGQRRPWPSADGGSKGGPFASVPHHNNGSMVEGLDLKGSSGRRNGPSGFHAGFAEKSGRILGEGASGGQVPPPESFRKGILGAPTFSKWSATLCTDPGGEDGDSSEANTPREQPPDRPPLPSSERELEFSGPHLQTVGRNGEGEGGADPIQATFNGPARNGDDSHAGVPVPSTKTVNSEEYAQIPNLTERREWVEHPEEGVHLTLTPHAIEGFHELRRVQFSGKLFNQTQADTWWAENKTRIREQYKIRPGRTRAAEVTLRKSAETGGQDA